ncbi:ribosomal protein L7/L12 [Saccharopolyspora kobensis]|uniref:50S ribosomal protein L7/L12 n=1 Tax=Saccharopolyspora kobensis TaxID=146035 RepID=A0A1H6DSW7_9PSEU|nr:ribosomal protein L7/L12 [Saccharopolyspora kobensis]SFE02874.1 ribosomal protein L7/L12 [Saccharopolyspora kobensis]
MPQGAPLSRRPRRDDFDRALDRLSTEGWQVVDDERFESDTATAGMLSIPSDLPDHFGPDGTLVEDITLRWRECETSMLQAAFAREGLVLSVPGQGPEEHDALVGMDSEGLANAYEDAMRKLMAAAHGTDEPAEGTVTCLATDISSDLRRIAEAFDRLTEHGYLAEPALWPTNSGCWQRILARTEGEQSPRAVFWNTQNHRDCFDPRGDLVDELYVHWAGERDLIAEILAGTGLAVRVPSNESTTFVLSAADGISSTDELDVVLESAGDDRLQVIKAVRQVVSGLGVADAKKLVESAPKPVLTEVATWAAEAAKKKLEAAGAEISLKRSSATCTTGG